MYLVPFVEEHDLRGLARRGVTARPKLVIGEIGVDLLIGLAVHVSHEEDPHALATPLAVQAFSGELQLALSLTVIAHQKHVLESRGDRTQRDLPHQTDVHLRRQADRAGQAHVPGLLNRVAGH